MSDTATSLADLETLGADVQAPAQIAAVIREQEIDAQGRAYATGRRKDAVARVWLKPGTGKIVVNGRDQEIYFARPSLRLVINQPFGVTERTGQYDVIATVKGGGLSGQAGAVKHGIAQALSKYEPLLRSAVKSEGFLTRDSRVVERKKYGKAKARRASNSRSVKPKSRFFRAKSRGCEKSQPFLLSVEHSIKGPAPVKKQGLLGISR